VSQATYYRRAETPTLLHLIGAWRALAGQQTEAIERSDWPGLLHLSDAKDKLKELMDAAIATSGMNPYGKRPPELQSAVEELMRLEQHNHQLLSERGRQTQSELEQSRTKAQRLRMIRNAYRRARQTRWHSYL
jgi:hypothetical protein